MSKLLKPATLLPVLIGIVVCVALVIVGVSEEAPGMCLIGLSIAFVLVVWGVSNAGIIRKGLLVPIYLFCFGVGDVVLSIVLLLDGEFESRPWLALIGVALGIVLAALGMARLRKVKVS